jgi:hypothetical protein
MKKLLLALSLFCAVTVPTTTECGLFDTAIEFLQKNGMDLLKKGAQLVSDNSDKIFGTIKDLTGIDAAAMAEKAKSLIPGPLFEKAKSLLLGETAKEADKEEAVMVEKAQEIINTTPGLTQPEKDAIFKEAKVIAIRNRAELEKTAVQSIEQKRSAIKQATYAKYGKGTPIN